LAGTTGSGKTYGAVSIMEYLRRQYPMAKRYFIDSSDDEKTVKLLASPVQIRGNKAPDLLNDSAHTLVWTPDTDKSAEYEAFFEKLLAAREPQIIIVDESSSVDQFESYIKLLKQARKHGGTIISLSQSIAGADQEMFRQMKHFLQFLINPDVYEWSACRRLLQISKEDQREPTGRYGFFYRRLEAGYTAREFRSINEFFGRSVRLNTGR
jgi:hypothetical protein